MSIDKEINDLLKVGFYKTGLGNKGLKVCLKVSHDSEVMEFFLSEREIDIMHEILHERD